MLEAATLLVLPAVQLTVMVGSKQNLSSHGVDADWALNNDEAVVQALMRSLGVEREQLRAEVIPADLAPTRRLQEESMQLPTVQKENVLLVMKLAVALPGVDAVELNAVADQIERSLKSADLSSFSTALKEEPLTRKATPTLPEIFVAVIGQPVISMTFALPAVAWLPAAWGSCDCVDSGLKSREVLCSAGLDALCAGAQKPPLVEPCDDECPFDVMCPMGKNGQMSCRSQVATLASGFAGAVVLWAMMCACWIRRTLRRRKETGSAYVDVLNKKVVWNLQKHHFWQEDDPVSGKKAHIIWNVDVEHAAELLQVARVPSATDVLQAPSTSGLELGNVIPAAETDLARTQSGMSSPSRAPSCSSMDKVGWVWPAYTDGDLVEYFSASHGQWLLATVHVIFKPGRPADPVYHLTVHFKQQEKHDVPLDLLRYPLCQGEMVQLFSKDDRSWTLARVTACRKWGESKMVYNVIIGDSADVVSDVPAERLRRTFCIGEHVEVFRGAQHGWVSSVVTDMHTKLCLDPQAATQEGLEGLSHTSCEKEAAYVCSEEATRQADDEAEEDLEACRVQPAVLSRKCSLDVAALTEAGPQRGSAWMAKCREEFLQVGSQSRFALLHSEVTHEASLKCKPWVLVSVADTRQTDVSPATQVGADATLVSSSVIRRVQELPCGTTTAQGDVSRCGPVTPALTRPGTPVLRGGPVTPAVTRPGTPVLRGGPVTPTTGSPVNGGYVVGWPVTPTVCTPR